MKIIDSKTSAFRAIRVVGICLLAFVCANIVYAQNVDYSDCIPFGVSTDGWTPVGNVSIPMYEYSAPDAKRLRCYPKTCFPDMSYFIDKADDGGIILRERTTYDNTFPDQMKPFRPINPNNPNR